jgi:deoxyadenosine/deoxycytidine kinase
MMYIVISGNSGAGKSTLLKAITEDLRGEGLAVQACDERQFHHPLLEKMFSDPEQWALPVQLNFVTQRSACLLAAAGSQGSEGVLVMERCLPEDRLFFEYYVRRGSIPAEIQPAYESLVGQLIRLTPRPTVLVHLKGRVQSLYDRLERAYATRQRPVELLGEDLRAYLQAMNEIYADWPRNGDVQCDHYLEFDIDAPGYDPAEVVAQVRSLQPVGHR